MFFSSLAKMHFHFDLDLVLLFYVDPNCLKISSFHCDGSLPSGRLRSFGYYSTTLRVPLVSVNLVTCEAKWNFCFRSSAIRFVSPLSFMDLSIDLCAVTFIFTVNYLRRCLWCNGYRRGKWTRRHEFKSWTRLIAFPIALIPLGKVWIQLFSLQLWANSRTDWFLQPWCGN